MPKDVNQAAYIFGKQQELRNDPILNITQIIKGYETNHEDRFIRSYTLDDGAPKFIAFMDKQLNSLVDFCCNDRIGFKSLMFCDLTFQLGPFYLLLTVHSKHAICERNTYFSCGDWSVNALYDERCIHVYSIVSKAKCCNPRSPFVEQRKKVLTLVNFKCKAICLPDPKGNVVFPLLHEVERKSADKLFN